MLDEKQEALLVATARAPAPKELYAEPPAPSRPVVCIDDDDAG